jgi:hypothetical protein
VFDTTASVIGLILGGRAALGRGGAAASAEAASEEGALGRVKRAGCSFAEGTPVATNDGLKSIGELKIGDRVLARSEETGAYAFQPITQVLRHEDPVKVHLTLEDPAKGVTEAIETTPEHPFYVPGRGFVPAGSLKPDDAVSGAAAGALSVVHLISGQSGTSEVLRVKNLTFENQPFLAYDLEVGQDQTFFVGRSGAWVHNCDSKQQVLAKVAEMKEAMTPWEKDNTTYGAAHVTTRLGVDEMWVSQAGMKGYAEPRIRGNAINAKAPAKGADEFGLKHINDAEMHLYRAAEDEGATINALGATRDVCTFCQKRLPDNIPIVTPLKK